MSGDVKKSIRKFITEEFLIEDNELKDDESLFDAGIIDSLGMIKLTAFLEKEFGMAVNPSEATMDNFSTIDKIVKNISEKTGKNN